MRETRVWSLLRMLKEIDPEGVVKAISLLASEAKRLNIGYEDGLKNGHQALYWEPDYAKGCLLFCQLIGASAEALNMIGVGRAAERLSGWIQGAVNNNGHLSLADIRLIADGLGALVVSYGDELDGRKIFAMTPQYAHHYPQGAPLFGEAIADAFPDSVDDIDEAGKCLAMGLPTACVFHLMRGAESAAAVILTHLGGDPMDEHGEVRPFGSLAQLIEKEIDKMPRGRRKDDWMRLKSFMSSINRGTRTKVAHPGTTYSDGRADSLIGLTKGFLQEAEELLSR